MSKLRKEIKSSGADKFVLFFNRARIGEEVELNLSSISLADFKSDEDDLQFLSEALWDRILEIEEILTAQYPGSNMKLYTWYDEGEMLLRWTVISDIDEIPPPFSSKVKLVELNTVVKNWLTHLPVKEKVLSIEEIDKLLTDEVATGPISSMLPTLDVFVRRIPSDNLSGSE